MSSNSASNGCLDEKQIPYSSEVRFSRECTIANPRIPRQLDDKFKFLSSKADLDIAKDHEKASKFKKEKSTEDPKPEELCPCCDLPINGEPISLLCSLKELHQLGPSVYYYFHFTGAIILWLIVYMLFAGIISTYEYMQWKNPPYIYEDLGRLGWEIYLHLGVVIAYILLYILFHRFYKQKIIDKEAQATATPSDYAIMIMGLPQSYKTEDLKEHIKKSIGLGSQLVNLVSTYNISEYLENLSNITHIEIKRDLLIEIIASNEKSHSQIVNLRKKTKNFENKLINLERSQEKAYKKMIKSNHLQFAFASFSTRLETAKILEKWKFSYFKWIKALLGIGSLDPIHFFEGKIIFAEKAPSPEDIIWNNLNYSRSLRFIKERFTDCVVLACSYLVLLAVQGILENNANGLPVSQKVAYFRSESIFLMNKFLWLLIIILCSKEKQITYTKYTISALIKVLIFTFINSIYESFIILSYTPETLVRDMQSVTITELSVGFMEPLIYLLNIPGIIKEIRKYFLRRKLQMDMPQYSVNLIYEGPLIDLAEKNASVLKIAALCLFYSPLIPYGPCIAIAAIVFEVCAFKYMLLRVHSKPKFQGPEIPIKAYELLPWLIFVYSVGVYLWFNWFESISKQSNTDRYSSTENLIGPLMVSITFSFAILSFLNFDLIGIKASSASSIALLEHNYFDDLINFETDYERSNPITSFAGKERFEKFKRNKDVNAYINDIYNEEPSWENDRHLSLDGMQIYKKKEETPTSYSSSDGRFKKNRLEITNIN